MKRPLKIWSLDAVFSDIFEKLFLSSASVTADNVETNKQPTITYSYNYNHNYNQL